jgi:hypothetical protein
MMRRRTVLVTAIYGQQPPQGRAVNTAECGAHEQLASANRPGGPIAGQPPMRDR